VKKLLRGIEEFRRTRRAGYAASMARLAQGQEPDTLAIACSDSRISPVEFAPTDPGDVFVLRNVGGFAPPYDADPAPRTPSAGAAIEYALAALPVTDVIVCGHSGCGAIRAIRSGKVPPGSPHLAAWLAQARGALAGIGDDPAGTSSDDRYSRESVLRQVANLRTYPGVRERERDGRLRLWAWWFDVEHAEVYEHDAGTGRFAPLDEARLARRIAESR
jgi:carbonic anhydrase